MEFLLTIARESKFIEQTLPSWLPAKIRHIQGIHEDFVKVNGKLSHLSIITEESRCFGEMRFCADPLSDYECGAFNGCFIIKIEVP